MFVISDHGIFVREFRFGLTNKKAGVKIERQSLKCHIRLHRKRVGFMSKEQTIAIFHQTSRLLVATLALYKLPEQKTTFCL